MRTWPLLLSLMVLSLNVTAAVYFGNMRIGDTPARAIAMNPSLPGKFVDGQCLPFARGLQRKMQAAGIPSRIVAFRTEGKTQRWFRWMVERPGIWPVDMPANWLTDTRCFVQNHAVVIYRDQGRTYIMDNQSFVPRWVREDSLEAMTQQFVGWESMVQAAWVVDGAAAKWKRKSIHLTNQ